MRRILPTGCVLMLALLATACGVRPSEVIDAGEAPRQQVTERATLYWISDGRLVAYPRMTPTALDPAAAVTLLLDGPTPAELTFNLRTAVPTGTYAVTTLTNDEHNLEIDFNRDVSTFGQQAIDQIVCTAANAYGDPNVRIVITDPTHHLEPHPCPNL